MFYALDNNNKKVYSYYASRDNVYHCPICNGKVTLKAGNFKVPHFAHVANECYDKWNYDMSEWHMSMQEYFYEEYREVVCRLGKNIHRADILKDGVVLEFQHSPISLDEFIDRNNFYRSCGYKVMWVFDVSAEFENKSLYWFESKRGNSLLRWKYPKQVLKYCPYIGDNNDKFALFLFWEHDEEGIIIEKVIWSSKDENDEYDFKRIVVSDYSYSIEPNMNLSHFFKTTKNRVEDYLKDKPPFQIKKIGVKGFKKEYYICPRRPDEFGLKAFGEKGCHYCKHCGALEEIGKGKFGSNYNVYCCYPKQVNKETDPSLDLYESNAPIFK